MNPTQYIKTKFNIKDTDPKPYVLKGVEREELYQLFAELGYRVGCEVGLEKGKNLLLQGREGPCHGHPGANHARGGRGGCA